MEPSEPIHFTARSTARHELTRRVPDQMAKAVAPCPVEEAIRMIGGKWKLLVLRSLLLNGSQRYNDLLGTVTAISPKELTRNLRELSGAGLVAREPGMGRTARYDLTKLGKGLMPTFKKLLSWGMKLPAFHPPSNG
jgi:DNA-binding HxlR family transcriptional regulator